MRKNKQPALQNDISFFEKVYEVVRLVPYGRVTSYGAIAEYLGTKGSARMVGWAMNKSHVTNVPAHRVVNRNGILTGKHHFGEQDMMKQLLESEGIQVEEDKIIRFTHFFWDPKTELHELDLGFIEPIIASSKPSPP